MKRKLISYDVFENLEGNSLSRAQKELTEAETIVASALGLSGVKLHCYGLEDALYESTDGTYVHVNYQIKNNELSFDNVEELVLNEQDEIKVGKDTVRKMIDAVLENNSGKADQLFVEFVGLPGTRRILRESIKSNKKLTEAKKKHCHCNMALKNMRKDKCNEWSALVENIDDYLRYQDLSPIIRASSVASDDKGNVTSLRIPTEKVRNEAKLLQLTYKNMMDTELKILRGKAKGLSENMSFCKAMADVKRHNAVSDNDALQEAIENIVSKWPTVLYLTQVELSEQIKSALRTVGATNYDDQTCDFMAEGILRVAHSAYSDKVNRIVDLASAEMCQECDQYEAFQNIVGQFYTTLDENTKREMDMYVDLYSAFREIHNVAAQQGHGELKVEAAKYLSDLSAVIKGEMSPDAELIRTANDWLTQFVETNLEGSEWKVSNAVRHTVTGDVPEMAEKARQGYAPSKDFSGDWGDSAPVSDGKNYRGGLADEMRSKSWGNISGNTWPELNNPYVPKSFGTYTGTEPGVDKTDDTTGQWQSKDTWPALQNPYIPASVTPQLNQGKEQDAVK